MDPPSVRPVGPDRWDDLERLFGPNGAYSGCWCMWWRVTSAEFSSQAGEGLRRRLAELVATGPPPGLLAYRRGDPVGWVAVGPRSEYPRLGRSPKLRPVDDLPVWSVTCFYVHRRHRRTGVARALLEAAVDHARRGGARWVEGYPIDTGDGDRRSSEVFTGTLDLFASLGFAEVARRGGRPIVRLAT